MAPPPSIRSREVYLLGRARGRGVSGNDIVHDGMDDDGMWASPNGGGGGGGGGLGAGTCLRRERGGEVRGREGEERMLSKGEKESCMCTHMYRQDLVHTLHVCSTCTSHACMRMTMYLHTGQAYAHTDAQTCMFAILL